MLQKVYLSLSFSLVTLFLLNAHKIQLSWFLIHAFSKLHDYDILLDQQPLPLPVHQARKGDKMLERTLAVQHFDATFATEKKGEHYKFIAFTALLALLGNVWQGRPASFTFRRVNSEPAKSNGTTFSFELCVCHNECIIR